MAKKEKEQKEGILATAAKAIGKAAGTIAHVAGVEGETPAPQPKKVKPAKLEKKNKHRLPRKEKKAQKKATTAIKEELVGQS